MWHVDCMFKMGCRFEMTRATTEGTCTEICSHNLNMLRETIFDVTSFYFLTMPQGLVAILTFNPFSLSQTSPDMWQISTYIIILTQLLYCHRELSQAVISFSLLCVTGEDQKRQTKVSGRTVPRHTFRETAAIRLVISLVSCHILLCANVWHSAIFKWIYSTEQIMVDGDR